MGLATLAQHGVDPLRLAHELWSVLPNVISIPLNAAGSDNAINASIADLVKTATRARPLELCEDFETWYLNREEKEKAALDEFEEIGTMRGTQRGRMLEKVKRVDELV